MKKKEQPKKRNFLRNGVRKMVYNYLLKYAKLYQKLFFRARPFKLAKKTSNQKIYRKILSFGLKK